MMIESAWNAHGFEYRQQMGSWTRFRWERCRTEYMSNRVVLITGASRGIGKACASILAAGGYRIVLAARSLDKLEEVAAGIRAVGAEAFDVEMDLGSKDSISQAIGKAAKEFGRI